MATMFSMPVVANEFSKYFVEDGELSDSHEDVLTDERKMKEMKRLRD
jgi:hypothetical protein